MRDITVIPAAKVTAKYKKEATAWSKWDSNNRGKDMAHYAASERVLIVEGSAKLKQQDGKVITIGKGDAATFHTDFKCTWEFTDNMKAHFSVDKKNDNGDEDEDGSPWIEIAR